MKFVKIGQDAFVTCGSKLWKVSRKLIAGGLLVFTTGVLLNMASSEHAYFRPLIDAVTEISSSSELEEEEESEDNMQ